MATAFATKRSWLIARRDAKVIQLSNAEDTMDALLAQQVADSSINTGEGSSRALMLDITKLSNVMDQLEAEICSLSRRISGVGDIQYMNVRRKR